MTKEFEINDILNAVNTISKIEKKKNKTIEKKDLDKKNAKHRHCWCHGKYFFKI